MVPSSHWSAGCRLPAAAVRLVRYPQPNQVRRNTWQPIKPAQRCSNKDISTCAHGSLLMPNCAEKPVQFMQGAYSTALIAHAPILISPLGAWFDNRFSHAHIVAYECCLSFNVHGHDLVSGCVCVYACKCCKWVCFCLWALHYQASPVHYSHASTAFFNQKGISVQSFTYLFTCTSTHSLTHIHTIDTHRNINII